MSAKRGISTAFLVILAAGAGWFARERVPSLSPPKEMSTAPGAAQEGPCPGGAQPLYWKAPMDPTYIRDEPGKSPMGMDLVPQCPGDARASTATGVQIDPFVVQSIGVREAAVERRDLARKIRTVGRVAYDERLVAHVHTKIQGWIERLHVDYEGQRVKRGQPLLEIYSPELVSTQEELLVAARYRDLTERSPFADVSEGGAALFDATRRRLELWDIPERDIERLLATDKVRKTLTLYAPTGGVVNHMMVRAGMEVGPNANLYTIADLSRVWVYADIYEYELPWVSEGQRGAVELSYLPGVRFEGEVTYVYPFLDPKTRTARVRIELPNPDLILKPDMFANVTIETETRPNVVAVPEEAVIRSGRRTLAIVAVGDGRFEPREIELGLDSGNGWLEVKRGLHEGDRVVTSGQFLIDSESKLQEAVQKLLASGAAGDSTRGGMSHEGHEMPGSGMEHEGHTMPDSAAKHEGHAMPGPPTGHEGHSMPAPPMDHTGHEMPAPSTGHEGHSMPDSGGEHEGHAMPDPGMKHEGHSMPEPGTSQSDHSSHGAER
jgi:Cu(I)/Ag(I) efflux system membrane fusion protein/cobalt-zinc-cadmium efflux system membrane fusion protein